MPSARGAVLLAIVLCALLPACSGKKRRAAPPDAGPADGSNASDASSASANDSAAAVTAFPELAELPRAQPLRQIELPTRIDVPRFETHGPLISGGLAVIASSQLGFAALDWRAGKIAWSKAAGAHVAPPLSLPSGDLVLLGDCATPPQSDEPLLGCLRVVAASGADRSYGAVVGERALAEAMRSPGAQRAWVLDGEHVAWQRGDTVVTVELATGRASRGAAPVPPLVVRYKDDGVVISLDEEGQLTGRALGSKPARSWTAPGRFAALIGTVPGQPYETPMLRVVRASAVRGMDGAAPGAYFDVLDLDAMTAAGGQAAFPSPGIQLLGTASGPGASAALAVRLDRSLRRDYIVAYTATARIAWAYPLPVMMRADPVGLAIADDAVLVFHDGDTLTVLPPIEGDP